MSCCDISSCSYKLMVSIIPDFVNKIVKWNRPSRERFTVFVRNCNLAKVSKDYVLSLIQYAMAVSWNWTLGTCSATMKTSRHYSKKWVVNVFLFPPQIYEHLRWLQAIGPSNLNDLQFFYLLCFVCLFVCIHTQIHTYIHTHTHTHTHIHANINTYLNTYTYIHRFTYIHARMHTYTHIYTDT